MASETGNITAPEGGIEFIATPEPALQIFGNNGDYGVKLVSVSIECALTPIYPRIKL